MLKWQNWFSASHRKADISIKISLRIALEKTCLRYLITLSRCKLELDVILNLMLLTSKSVAKAISLLIVAMFLFVQIASASHNHHHEEDTPEPNVCVACLASTQDDDGDFDLPPPPPTSFKIPNTLDLNLAPLSGATFGLNRIDVNALEPPNLRLSAPRAPPA